MLRQILYIYSNSTRLKLVSTTAIILLVFFSWWSLAVSLDAPAGPNDSSSQSYTLADICNQLQTGNQPTIASSFTEFGDAPDQDMCTLNEIYDLTPQPDPADAAQASDVLVDKTFWALNPSGQWGLTTGTTLEFAETALVIATGQDTCYSATGAVISCAGTGQDAEFQFGETADPRFTINGDGTVTDNLTDLIWLRNANCFGTRSWQNALDDANGLASGSCSLTDGSSAGDWRLPNIVELRSLIDISPADPSLPSGHPFTNFQNTFYWSSTTRVGTPGSAYGIVFDVRGQFVSTSKTGSWYVLPVR